jgi:uracil-DNA glycosylase family 4
LTREADLEALERRVVGSKVCPGLLAYIRDASNKKVRRYRDQGYWGKPVPGFGDPCARLLIVGLAPALHGGNRTGRMFTGDSSGNCLMKALHLTGFANEPTSVSKDDGLRLNRAFVTALVRCAPPKNKPTPIEIKESLGFLEEEVRLLEDAAVVVTLGRLAFQYCIRLYGPNRKLEFRHGAVYDMDPGMPVLVASCHPSRKNAQTGRLKWDQWLGVFETASRLVVEKN